MSRKIILILSVLLLGAAMVFAGGTNDSRSAAPASGGQGVTTNVTPVPLKVTPQIGDTEWHPTPARSYTTNPRYPRQPAVSNVNGYPIVQNRFEIKMAFPHHAYNLDYYDNEVIKYMEDLTNIRVNWDLLPEVGALERVNLMFAGGDNLPDAFYGYTFSSSMLITLGAQGLIVPLQDIIERNGYNIKKLFEFDRAVYPAMTSADGNVYGLPSHATNEANQVSMRFWINKPFMDKLGMRMPTTTEEYYQYLVAVKNRDPNGNGRADEIPLIGASSANSWHAEIDGFLMNAFAYNETSTDRDAINRRRMFLTSAGKIDVSYNKDGWRQGLEYLARLCREGLLDPSSFTIANKEDLRGLVEIAGDPIVGSLPNGGFHEFANPSGERRKDFVVVPPLKGPNGVQQAWYDEYSAIGTGRGVITKDCQWPDVVMKWIDYSYTPDWWTRNRYGTRDRDWRVPAAGTRAVSGGNAMYEEISIVWGTPQKLYLVNNINWGRWASYNRTFSGDVHELEYVLWNAREAYWPYRFRQSVPRNLPFTVEEARDFTQLNTLIVEYIEQFMAQVVTGRIQLNDTTWNNYVREMDRMGLPRLLQVAQTAFDRSWAAALGYK